MTMEGVIADQFTFNMLIAKCCETGEMSKAFDLMRLIPTTATFTSLMHILCKDANLKQALKLKGIMEHCGLKLDVAAYNVLISGLCANGDGVVAFELYEEMKQIGLWPNTTTYAVLIEAISAENNIIKGEMLLRDLQERGWISWDWDGSTQQLNEGLIIAMEKISSLRKNRRKPKISRKTI
ncbi:pentatricopeptide repeat-containing protein [Quercus suber]|uniref:Pentatricopeptide repeat-containing protein n=1 Tax=Quercus suber TaxID=58331 RepID=A0AAW0KV78_QUESU